MTKDAAQRSPSALLRAVSMSNGRWTFYEAVNLKIDLTWSSAIAYHAMIRAGRALMYSKGYLPTAKHSHKTIVEFTRLTLGDEYHSLVGKFNRFARGLTAIKGGQEARTLI